MAALKDWKTRGAPVKNESDDDSATVSDSNDSGHDEDLFEPLYHLDYGPRLMHLATPRIPATPRIRLRPATHPARQMIPLPWLLP